MQKVSLRAFVCSYLNHLAVTGYSPRTIKDKDFCLNKFTEWCEARGIVAVTSIRKETVEKYQKHLYHYHSEVTDKPLSFYTQLSRLSAVRGFFSWMVKVGNIIYNPSADISLPKIGKRLPKNILSIEEVQTVLNTPDISTPLGIRDRAILETFYSSAVRRSELINLMLFDLNTEAGVVMVRQGKGNKDRLIPIGNRALKWIDKYLCEVRPFLASGQDSGHLFLTYRGGAFTTSAISNMVKGYFDKAEIKGRATCHALRHAAATHMLENGADIRFIQEQLGHADISTTTIYTQVSIRKLKEVHQQFHQG